MAEEPFVQNVVGILWRKAGEAHPDTGPPTYIYISLRGGALGRDFLTLHST